MLPMPIPARRVWQRLIDSLFPAHRKPRRQPLRRGRSLRPQLEELENRLAPAQFNPTSGDELRADLLAADGNSDATNTITLTGQAYQLTTASPLLVQNQNSGTVPTKTITIVGPAVASGKSPSAIIEPGANVTTEILDVEGTGIALTLENLAITGGKVVAAPANTPAVAQGGGIFIDGGTVTLSSVAVSGNVVQGASGINGGNGGSPGAPAPAPRMVGRPRAVAFISRPAR